MTLTERYAKIIRCWLTSARDYIASPIDRPDLAYYGTGTDYWGIQTHMKGFSAFAVAAADSRKREDIELALKMLRFTLEAYVGGSYHCTDGENVQWGHHWLASLAIERMMHGVDALDEWLTEHDRKRLREVLVSEASYICDERKVQADPVSPNVPESNLWAGAILHRVALMYPDTPRVENYREHGTALLLNSISVPSDAESEKIYSGKPMKDWFVGANYFESYALNHHGYMNVGYMVICLSNIAMLHFALKKAKLPAPPELYHHLADLWKLVRTCVFDDGRLMRIGGDTRVRYCYCQDYLIPVFALVSDVLGEDMSSEEAGWLDIIEREMAYNGNGSFLSERCELLIEHSPLYYTRLESDRACTLSMMWLWHKFFPEIFESKDKPSKNQHWYDEYHGSHYHRSENRMASFTWVAGCGPQGNLVPPSDSSLAEYKYNMIGEVKGYGARYKCIVNEHSGRLIPGGFITGGRLTYATADVLEEGITSDIKNAQNHLVFCALPDDTTVVTLQYCPALRRCWILDVRPLDLKLPNDLFNGEHRDYRAHGNSITVDEKLTVTAIYGGKSELHRGTARTININGTGTNYYGERGMLRVDEITVGGTDEHRWYDVGEALFDFAAAVRSDNKEASCEGFSEGKIRAVKVLGADGRSYIVAANFGSDAKECEIFGVKLTLSAGEFEVI